MIVINFFLRPKGFGQRDIDLAMLVLRIGGPRLLFTFNKLNQLPSTSFVYKALSNSMVIEFSYQKSITEIVTNNIKQFFSESSLDFFCSIKIDEIAISPKIRWCPRTNEILGFCFNHKYKIKSKFKYKTIHIIKLKKKKFFRFFV